ncbi:uncharacterized protein BKA78DRAFT_101729 [Phyllosticta capitalensis]|uniref:uncharacterized protein n=1 Tax=Phyllosticta capitalensis TaxID=121624 RepID=UPI00312E3AF8
MGKVGDGSFPFPFLPQPHRSRRSSCIGLRQRHSRCSVSSTTPCMHVSALLALSSTEVVTPTQEGVGRLPNEKRTNEESKRKRDTGFARSATLREQSNCLCLLLRRAMKFRKIGSLPSVHHQKKNIHRQMVLLEYPATHLHTRSGIDLDGNCSLMSFTSIIVHCSLRQRSSRRPARQPTGSNPTQPASLPASERARSM